MLTPDNIQSDTFQPERFMRLAPWCASRGCMWPIRHENENPSKIIHYSSCLFFTVDKETLCAGFNSSFAFQNITLLDCNVECCSGNNCNIQNLTTREYGHLSRYVRDRGLRVMRMACSGLQVSKESGSREVARKQRFSLVCTDLEPGTV